MLRGLVDLALTPLAFAAGYAMKAAARIDRRFPRALDVIDGLGVRVVRRNYYTPLVLAADLRRPLDEERPLPGLELNAAGQLALIGQFRFGDELRAIPEDAAGEGFHYRNGAYEWGDAEILYDMVRHFRPKRMIEVGSGHSTKMALAAIAANRRDDPAYACRLTCIEPYAAPWLEAAGVEVIRKPVEQVDPALFGELGAGDILFIDSSHMIRPQGDVVTEYLEILPGLAPGVVVQAHDIFTPRDYPHAWVIDERRLWNEQYLLEAFLSCNDRFEVICAVNWLAHNHRDRLGEAAPMLMGQPDHQPGAFWFRRR